MGPACLHRLKCSTFIKPTLMRSSDGNATTIGAELLLPALMLQAPLGLECHWGVDSGVNGVEQTLCIRCGVVMIKTNGHDMRIAYPLSTMAPSPDIKAGSIHTLQSSLQCIYGAILCTVEHLRLVPVKKISSLVRTLLFA